MFVIPFPDTRDNLFYLFIFFTTLDNDKHEIEGEVKPASLLNFVFFVKS